MGQVLHGSATTTEAVRRAIQRSQESIRVLANRYGVNPKTIAKWKNRNGVAEPPRDCRRLVGLSYAAMGRLSMAAVAA